MVSLCEQDDGAAARLSSSTILAALQRFAADPSTTAAAVDEHYAGLRRHGMVALLHHAVANETGSAPIARSLALRCADDVAAEAMWVLANRAELRALLGGLAENGITPLLLKGAPLGYTHYAQPHLRPRGDVDMLVPLQQRDSALAAMIRMGYRRGDGVTGEWISSQAELWRNDAGGALHVVDLHWRISNSAMLAGLLTFAELSEHALAVPALGPHARAPGCVHALLFACMHRAGHAHAPYHTDGQAQHGDRLIWLYDIDLLVRALTEADRTRFLHLVHEKALVAVCRDGLQATFNAFATNAVASLLAGLPAARHREATSRLLHGGWGGQLAGDLAALPHWSQRLALLREHALPAPGYMRHKYQDARVRWLPWLYARRAFDRLRTRKTAPR